jgi:hypothetical protein
LAFEYQGEQHYFSTATFGSVIPRQRKDKWKAEYAKSAGITLISIPYWWDRSSSSLAATISYHRPDITFDGIPHLIPIPTEFPKNMKTLHRPNVAQKYQEHIDPTGW